MYRKRFSLGQGLALLLLVVALGCNLPSATPTSSVPPGGDQMGTAVALTAQALLQATQAAGGTPAGGQATPTAPVSPPTPTLAPPTWTPSPLPQPTWTPSPTALPCNWAQFIADVTYPDGTEVEAGTTFVKTWRLKNIGSCAWTTAYTLIFDHGDRMGAPADLNLPRTVAPGETVDISVELQAPADPGTYKGYFRLRADDGEVFGIGGAHNGAFWVEIKVKASTPPSPTPTPKPSGPDLTIVSMSFSEDPPHKGQTFQVTVVVKNQGDQAAGAFTVQWWSSWALVGCNWPVLQLNPGESKTLTCDYTYGGWSTYDVKAVADPNNQVAETNENNNELGRKLQVKP